jgi:hypothetical protein
VGRSLQGWNKGIRCFALAAVFLTFAGCASTGIEGDSRQPTVPQSSRTEDNVAGTKDAETFRSALERAVADPGAAERLRIYTECLHNGDRLEVELFARGVGIWNGERAFHLPPEEITVLLRAVLAAGFAEMPSSYGGRPAREDGSSSGGPVRILCEVEVQIGDSSKRVEQLAEGEQSRTLEALAGEILQRCREPGAAGVGASDLSDGLGKLSRGILPPEVLRLILHKKPELFQAEDRGFLLRIRGRMVTTREYHRSTGYGPPRSLELSEGELEQLTERVSELELDQLPVNLFAPDYTDFSIELLDRRRSVQARQFPGIGPKTHGPIQKHFDALVEILTDLEHRVATEGVVPSRP